MNNIDLMNYWIKSSDRDYESMKKNFETNNIRGHYLLDI